VNNLRARGSLLETLRLARGLTQVELAQLTGIPQATLSKAESGALELEEERWDTVADVLRVPVSAFLDVEDQIEPALVFHRKQRTTPQSAVRRIGADAALAQQRINNLLDFPESTLVRHDLEDGFITPHEVAMSVRQELGVGTNPINDLTSLVEQAGAIVLFWTLDSLQVDAVATWPAGAAPIILIADHVSTERQRFTMAHELGHALMHGAPVEDAKEMDRREKEADSFAAEFLLPAAQLRQEWPASAELESLIELKRRWGVSLSALIRRAADADLLSQREYRDWSIRLSTSGMHRREPSPIAAEQPSKLIGAIREEIERGVSIDQLAARAHMYSPEFQTTFLEMEHAS
jgi:Zn-dependent peptidase ImmA (M78 family)/DNA-binding XRE family transcriptional regulator